MSIFYYALRSAFSSAFEVLVQVFDASGKKSLFMETGEHYMTVAIIWCFHVQLLDTRVLLFVYIKWHCTKLLTHCEGIEKRDQQETIETRESDQFNSFEEFALIGAGDERRSTRIPNSLVPSDANQTLYLKLELSFHLPFHSIQMRRGGRVNKRHWYVCRLSFTSDW